MKVIKDIAQGVYDDLVQRHKEPEKYRPIHTKIERLDEAIGGIVIPSYVAIGGSAKVGKTSVGLHIGSVLGASKRGKIIYYTLEELEWQMGARAIARMSVNVTRTQIRDLLITEEGFKEIKDIVNLLGYVDMWVEDKFYDVDKLIEHAIKNKALIAIVDYFQYLEGGEGRNEVERLRNNSRKFVRARNDHNLTTIMIYQKGDTGRADYTRAVYKDPDLVIEVEESIDYVTEKAIEGSLTLTVLPSRQAKRVKKIEVGFDGEHNRITNIPMLEFDE